MKTLLAAATALALVAGPALSGGMSEPVMEPEVVETKATSGSQDIIIPILLLAIVAAAASN